MTQSTSVTSVNKPTAVKTVRSLGGLPNQRPRQPEARAHGAKATVAKPSSAPPVLSRNASATRPRTKCAHAVVIPHDGQR